MKKVLGIILIVLSVMALLVGFNMLQGLTFGLAVLDVLKFLAPFAAVFAIFGWVCLISWLLM